MAVNGETIESLKDKLKRCQQESDRYWRKASRMEEERDRARRKLNLVQQVLDGHIHKGAGE